MKTTEFFNEIKKVSDDCTLEKIFDYGINRTDRIYEVILHSEPTDEIKSLCEEYGFSITQNIWNDVENGSIIARTIWEVVPTNTDDVEVASEEVME